MPQPDALRQPLELDVFQGPFDLLLTLVLREEVDLFELPLAQLVPAVLGGAPAPSGNGVGAGARFDVETASELTLLLAALTELKARRLLGEPEEEEPDLDAVEARERLAARLVAYAPYRRAAEWLGRRESELAGARYRRVPLTPTPPAPRREASALLAGAIAGLLTSPPAPSLAHLTARRVHLPGVIARLREALAVTDELSFDEVVADDGPLEEAMTLVAALELSRRGEAWLRQSVPFGDILIASASIR